MLVLLRMVGLTLPVPFALGYCWTQAVIQAELGAGQQTYNSIGLMLILVVLPLTLMFSTFYLLPIIASVGVGQPRSLRYRMAALTAVQCVGSWWGYLVLSKVQDVTVTPLAIGAVLALVSVGVQLLFFPIDTKPTTV